MDEQEPLIKVNVPTKTKCCLPCRYVLAILTFWGLSVTYALRVNLSVALVAMVNSTYANANADYTKNPECQTNTDNSTRHKDGEFKWDQETQGIILGSFFYGYIITQIPGGWLASRFGGKHLFGLGILCTSIFTLITPWVVHQGLVPFIALRVLEGLGEDGEFNWDQQTQGHILAAYFHGYLIPVTVGGWLSSKFGGKHLFGFGILCASLLTLITPLMARQGVGYLVAVRGLEGMAVYQVPCGASTQGAHKLNTADTRDRDQSIMFLFKGMAFPSINALWSTWAPPLERSRLLSFGFSGSRIGTILAMGVSGFLCDSDVMGGWPSVFYLFGAQGVLWFIVWTIFIYERPSEHPRITLEEKDYIETALESSQYDGEVYSTPWRSILTSMPVWAILITNFCTSWGFYIFLTLLPTYFQQVLNMNMSENGVLSALPSVSAYVLIMGSGVIADWLQTSKTLSTGETRKVLTTAGLVPAACLLVANSYVGCNDKAISVSIFTASGLTGLVSSGFMVSHLDIAPRYGGLIVGLSNTMGTLAGTIAPYITGWIINNRPTRTQWQKVFFLSAAIYIAGALVFLVFGSAKTQSWNSPKKRRIVVNDHTAPERQEIKG